MSLGPSDVRDEYYRRKLNIIYSFNFTMAMKAKLSFNDFPAEVLIDGIK
jgi:hypothetical protein